jgi:hypothetical protein
MFTYDGVVVPLTGRPRVTPPPPPPPGRFLVLISVRGCLNLRAKGSKIAGVFNSQYRPKLAFETLNADKIYFQAH